jgi:hypothetical protein
VEECSWTADGKCSRVECRFSLLAERPRIEEWDPLDVTDLVDALPTTCALDLANQGPMLIEEVATYLGLPRPLVEQAEILGMRKLTRSRDLRKTHWDGH